MLCKKLQLVSVLLGLCLFPITSSASDDCVVVSNADADSTYNGVYSNTGAFYTNASVYSDGTHSLWRYPNAGTWCISSAVGTCPVPNSYETDGHASSRLQSDYYWNGGGDSDVTVASSTCPVTDENIRNATSTVTTASAITEFGAIIIFWVVTIFWIWYINWRRMLDIKYL